MYNSGNRGSKASEVAHNWAHQKQSQFKKDTTAGSLYYEGNTIYSYGRHFPIAVISEQDSNIVYFTTRTYSNTTSKHLSVVRAAVNHKTVLYCENPDQAARNIHTENIQAFEKEAKYISQSLPKSKKPEIYLNQIAHQRQLLTQYAQHFDLNLESFALVYIYIESKDMQSKASEAEKIAMEKAEKARQKELAKKHAKELKDFRAFKLNRIYATKAGSDYLRYNNESKRVETSQGIQIPTEIAKRFYKWVKATIKAGGCGGECEQKILSYTVSVVNADFMSIGCHTIAITEADAIAKLLKW